MEYEIYDKPANIPHSNVASTSHHDVPHYYGHWVRRLFFAGALIMLVTLPLFRSQLAVPVPLSILAIVAVTFAAGFTNPRTKWIIVLDTVCGSIGLVIFGFQSIVGYGGIKDLLFFTNQILALIFLFAFYFSVKTLRGRFIQAREGSGI